MCIRDRLQGAYLEEPLFGPSGKLPKVLHERKIPEAQFDQKNPEIPVDPLKGIYPEGQGIITNSKAKLETAAPEPQGSVDNPPDPYIESAISSSESDTLNLEKAKDALPESIEINTNKPEQNR